MKNFFSNMFKRQDGWLNYSTNLGTLNSRTENTIYVADSILPKETVAALYKDNGIARRIVEVLVADSLKGFIDADPELLLEMGRISLKQKIFNAGTRGRLYGGALVVAFVDDGQEMIKPLDLKRIYKLTSLQVFDKHQVNFDEEDICNDIYNEHFGRPQYYTIGQQNSRFNNNQELGFKLHTSRCFLFRGEILPGSLTYNNGWDVSVLQGCYSILRNHSTMVNSSAEIMQDFLQGVLKIGGLKDMLSAGQESTVKERLNVLDRSRSVQNTILLDKDSGEEYSKLSSNVSGLDKLWIQFNETLSATTGMPMSKLFGVSPSGLNATGENDLRNWHDIVSNYRDDQVEPCIKWIIDILKNQQAWVEKPKNFNFTFPSLYNPSELDMASIKLTHAQIDEIYANLGALDVKTVWQKRFGNGQFQKDVKLEKKVQSKRRLENRL